MYKPRYGTCSVSNFDLCFFCSFYLLWALSFNIKEQDYSLLWRPGGDASFSLPSKVCYSSNLARFKYTTHLWGAIYQLGKILTIAKLVVIKKLRRVILSNNLLSVAVICFNLSKYIVYLLNIKQLWFCILLTKFNG